MRSETPPLRALQLPECGNKNKAQWLGSETRLRSEARDQPHRPQGREENGCIDRRRKAGKAQLTERVRFNINRHSAWVSRASGQPPIPPSDVRRGWSPYLDAPLGHQLLRCGRFGGQLGDNRPAFSPVKNFRRQVLGTASGSCFANKPHRSRLRNKRSHLLHQLNRFNRCSLKRGIIA